MVRSMTPMERNKVLRYCLARLRAWRAEYQLYSCRAPEEEDINHPFQQDATLLVEQEAQASTEDCTDLSFDREEMIIEPIADSRTHSILEIYPDDALQRETEPVARNDNRRNAFLDAGFSSIDTTSLSGYTPFAPTEPAVERTPRGKDPSSEGYVLAPELPMRPAASARVSVEQEPMVNADVSKFASTVGTRKRSFSPLPGLATVPKRAQSPLPVMAPTKMAVPKVVEQVLSDVGPHWEQLAKALASRVEESGLHSLLIASAMRGEGATTVATALAVSVARSTDLRVLIVDADFRRPSLARNLSINPRKGLEHHILGDAPVENMIVKFSEPSVDALMAVQGFEIRDRSVEQERFCRTLGELRTQYDLVIVDLGAILAGGHPIAIPDEIDAALVVRDPAKSSYDVLDRLDHYLSEQGISSLGVIENGVDQA